MDKLTRGMRNNNPANIRRVKGCNWLGLANTHSSGMNLVLGVPWDVEFCQFKELVFGYRALIVTLRTYFTKRGVKSINDLVNRYAPASDGNSPIRYAAHIADTINYRMNLGISVREPLNLDFNDLDEVESYSFALLYNICDAITIMECGHHLRLSVYRDALKMIR